MDADTVYQERLTGSRDETIFDACVRERRCLVSLDMDFADVLRFPPVKTAGVALLRPPRGNSPSVLEHLLRNLLTTLATEAIDGRLWVVEAGAHSHPRGAGGLEMPELLEYALKGGTQVLVGLGTFAATVFAAGWAMAHYLNKRHVELADRERDFWKAWAGVTEEPGKVDRAAKQEAVAGKGGTSGAAIRPPSSGIECRGILDKECAFPSGDGSETLQCQTIAFRNHGRNVHALSASLDYFSDSNRLIPVNAAWWCEDARIITSLYIGSGETRHLVVAVRFTDPGYQACGVVGKDCNRDHGQFMPDEVQPLAAGRWRLKIDLRADNYRQTYFSIGRVADDGNSKWSSPVAEKPIAWGE